MIDPKLVYSSLKKEIDKVIMGNEDMIHQVIIAFFAEDMFCWRGSRIG